MMMFGIGNHISDDPFECISTYRSLPIGIRKQCCSMNIKQFDFWCESFLVFRPYFLHVDKHNYR